MKFNGVTATEQVYRLLREDGHRVSTFHNPGSLLGTMPAHVEIHAVKDGVFRMMRVYVSDFDLPEYVAACRLAKQCGIDLE